jgi:Flavoprotein
MSGHDAEEHRRVLYVVVCAAPPASDVHELVKLAQAVGWRVCVIATPEAMHWIDPAMLAELTGYDVRSEYRSSGETKSLPEADAIAVAPATFNTVNKFRAGIADNMAVGVLACRGAHRAGAQRQGRPRRASGLPGQPPRAGVLGRARAGSSPPAPRGQDGALGGHP